MLPSIRHKILSQVPQFRQYQGYVIDVNGNLWSYRNKQPRIIKPNIIKNGYKRVTLWNKCTRRNFYLHRLVAICFLPTDDITKTIIHKNGDISDNRIENLEWHSTKTTYTKVDQQYVLNEELTNKIESVFDASRRKGLPTKNTDQFFTDLVNNALNDYIKQYGLWKIM